MREVALLRGVTKPRSSESGSDCCNGFADLEVKTLKDVDAGGRFHCLLYWGAQPTYGRITNFGNNIAVIYRVLY